MSRRPRAPVSLRVLGRDPSISTELLVDGGETHRLPDPEPPTEPVRLDPPVATAADSLVGDIAPTPAFELAPTVDVVPATLVGSVFALRRVDLRFPALASQVVPVFRAESRGIPIPVVGPSRRSQPTAALVRRASPMPLESIDRALLRECLEQLYRASNSPPPGDLTLVGVYDRVPVGAIAGAASTATGLELRLRAGGGARRGLLVVGRRRSTGVLVTAEVATP
ncbi:MAG: hypothetical protein ABI317_02385 [Gaiellales bacterium]